MHVHGLPVVKIISAGDSYSLAIKDDGSVWAWGQNYDGKLGNGTTFSKNNPVQVSGLKNITMISSRESHNLVIKDNCSVWAWGDNHYGQLGIGSTTNRFSPVQINELAQINMITSGHFHNFARKNDGSIWAWGMNCYGQLGDETNIDRKNPVQVSELSDVNLITAGRMHSIASKVDGSVWAWGNNSYCQIGNGTNIRRNYPIPMKIPELSEIIAVSTGGNHSLAIKDNGSVWAWGANYYGQLGDGTNIDQSTPEQVNGLSQIVMIVAGDYHSLAIKSDGSVWAWGRNNCGQLGDGTTTNKNIPVQIFGLSQVTMIAAAESHSLAIKNDGSVWGWGANSHCQLGDGTRINKSSPVQVTELSKVIMISAGTYHSLALKDDGSVWAWGENYEGQLGYAYPTYIPEPLYSEIQCISANFTTSQNRTIMIPVMNVAKKTTTLTYTTIDGTAISNVDYLHTTGSMTFQANESQKNIPITILNNPKNHTEKTFELLIDAPDDIFLNDASRAVITISSGNSVNTPYLQTFTQKKPAYGWTYYSSKPVGRIQQTAGTLRMDTIQDYVATLDEATLHIDLFSAENVTLNFFQKALASDICTSLPTTFKDHIDGDGVSISNDGYTWFRIIDCDVLMTDSQGKNYTIDLDAEIEQIQNTHDPNFIMTSDTQIKFQQYGNRVYPSGGREWDNIIVTASFMATITSTVHYFGSQTGTLHVTLVDQISELPVVVPETYIWNKDTKNQDFIANILTGNYTITAFIDTNNNGEINIWEAQGSYSITVAIDDNTNVYHTTLHDPKDLYTPQFVEHTGSYKTWFDNYPTIGQPDEDFDQDGYNNFQEYMNGTDPETTNIAYVYNHYDPAFDQDNSDISNQYQVISTNPLVPKARPGEAFLMDINYTTSDNNPETTGLGLAIHFNSHFMEFAGFSNVLTETLAIHISDLTINVRDENNEGIPNDGFEDTDKVITIGWEADADEKNFPGPDVELPVCLCTLQFNVKSEAQGITFTDRSVIRFSATSKDTRYQFYAPSTTVVLEPFNFDIDGDRNINALTDGLLIMRYLFGMIDNSPTTQADPIDPQALRSASSQIWSYLNDGRIFLDIDGDSTEDALTDGLLILRYMFGIEKGEALIVNAISKYAPRITDDAVVPFIKQYLPQKASPLLSSTVHNNMQNYQKIILSPSTTKPPMDTTFDLSVMYDVSNDNVSLPGIGIRIHYDSTKFEYMGVANMVDFAISQPYEAPEDLNYTDSDPNTDRMIIIAWANLNGNSWPGLSLPCKLVDILFKVKKIPECSTTIHAGFTSLAAFHDGKTQNTTIHIAQAKPTIEKIGHWYSWEDTPGEIAFSVSDPDTNFSDLNISVASFCPDLIASMDFQLTSQNEQTILFSPAANQYGSCAIAITVCDQIYTVSESFMLTILSVDDPPQISHIPDQVIYGEPLYAEVEFSVNDIDNSPDDFMFFLSSSNSAILPNDHIRLSGNGSNKTLKITPTTNEMGSITINVAVLSGGSDSCSFLLSFNQAPVAKGSAYSLDEDRYFNLPLEAEDLENDPLSYTIVNEPVNGDVKINGDIAIYTPTSHYHGMDRFTFKASDGFSDSKPATIILTVYNVYDPPQAYTQTVATSENMPINISLTGYSPDNLPLTFEVTNQPSHGTLSQSTPYLTYTPNHHFYGTDAFQFIVNDGLSDSAYANIPITV
ncbi:MAG: hypothetical protein OMM_08341, partial [Candidatus Magnetoglobus multicellularis str. Araruama]